jgi:hypothetical protein
MKHFHECEPLTFHTLFEVRLLRLYQGLQMAHGLILRNVDRKSQPVYEFCAAGGSVSIVVDTGSMMASFAVTVCPTASGGR